MIMDFVGFDWSVVVGTRNGDDPMEEVKVSRSRSDVGMAG